MALNDAALDVAGEAIAAAITHLQFHSGAPGAAGDQNVISGGRFPVTLVSTDGDLSLSAQVDGTGLTPETPVANISFWSASSSGTYYGFVPLTSGDAATNASGEYSITAITIPASAS